MQECDIRLKILPHQTPRSSTPVRSSHPVSPRASYTSICLTHPPHPHSSSPAPSTTGNAIIAIRSVASPPPHFPRQRSYLPPRQASPSLESHVLSNPLLPNADLLIPRARSTAMQDRERQQGVLEPNLEFPNVHSAGESSRCGAYIPKPAASHGVSSAPCMCPHRPFSQAGPRTRVGEGTARVVFLVCFLSERRMM